MAGARLRRRYGAGTTVVMVMASHLCDIDALSSLGGASIAIFVRRTLSHSVVGIPLLSLAAAYVLRYFYPHLRLRVLWGLSLLGCAVHVGCDWLNAYGVALLYPLSTRRFEWGLVFIADPMLVGLLAVPLLMSAFWRGRAKAEYLCRTGLGLAAGYLVFCAVNHTLATHHLERYVRQAGLVAQRVYVVPEPLGPHRWSGLIRVEHGYRVVLIYSLSGRVQDVQAVDSMMMSPLVVQARRHPRAIQAERLFKAPIWQVEGHTAVLRDLRFSYQVLQNDWDPFRFRFKRMNGDIVAEDWTREEFVNAVRVMWRKLRPHP